MKRQRTPKKRDGNVTHVVFLQHRRRAAQPRTKNLDDPLQKHIKKSLYIAQDEGSDG
jgi:hypothetical protein